MLEPREHLVDDPLRHAVGLPQRRVALRRDGGRQPTALVAEETLEGDALATDVREDRGSLAADDGARVGGELAQRLGELNARG